METSLGNLLLITGTIIVISLWWFTSSKKRAKKFQHLKNVPGPKGLPIIGNLHQMSKVQTQQFCKWSEEFGDIYKLKLATQELIIISNTKMSKEIFNHPMMTGAPRFDAFTLYEDQSNPKLGILGSDGEMWEVHRRFLLRQLREFGFGKSSMEQLIEEELNELLGTLEKKQGSPLTGLDMIFRLPVINSLWNILTSQRFKQDDPELLLLSREGTQALNDAVSGSGLLMFIPILRKIFPEMSGYRRIRSFMDPILNFFTIPVEEHKANVSSDGFRDFIDVYLSEVNKTNDPKSPFYGELAEKQLVNILFDVYFAGSDTTINTLSWTMLYLCRQVEAQTKLQQEIEKITDGNSRRTVLTDRKSMPYTQALIDEVLRHSSVIADGVAHRALADLEFQGYFIPKDTWVQPNLYFIHHNPKIWGNDADTFRPERFLSESDDGTGPKYVKSEHIQPFQVGRRVCVGETLARDTLFLFITNIFQKFSVAFAPGGDQPSELESLPGFFRSPKTFSVVMTNRDGNSG